VAVVPAAAPELPVGSFRSISTGENTRQVEIYWQVRPPTARVKKQAPVHFTVLSTYVDRFLQYLAPSILRKYATQKLLICPPHIHNAAALLSFQRFESVFFGSMCTSDSEKSRISVLK